MKSRGVQAIIDMVAMTRFDCMCGSSAMMRQAYFAGREPLLPAGRFGATLTDQPLMQNVLADLILPE